MTYKYQLRSPAQYIMLGLIVLTGFGAAQSYLSLEPNRLYIQDTIERSVRNICNRGYRPPLVKCPVALPPVSRDPYNNEPLKHQFAKLPDLSTALDKLQWRGGSEIEAVRLITLLRALTYSRYNESRFTNAQQDALLTLIGYDYPYLALASTCFYCIAHANYLGNFVAAQRSPFPELVTATKHLPTFTYFAANNGWLDESDVQEVAMTIAYLSNAGDRHAAQGIYSLLVKNKNYAAIKNWVSDGLNGGWSLSPNDYQNLPRELLIAAWEQGAGMAFAPNELTEYLVSAGYRPALRYVVWLKSGAAPYLTHHAGYGNDSEYILQKYTRFPATSGSKLVDYYNANWQSIEWHGESQLWK